MIDKSEKIHIYYVPGLAASISIFEHIKLPEEKFEIHFIKWFVPDSKMKLTDYAAVMSRSVVHENSVLIGVSFGGIMVQEMAKFKKVRKIIIISSVKTSDELPRKMRIAGMTSIHKLLPVSLVKNVELVAKYGFGEKVNKRIELYEKYLDVRDPVYLTWAIDQLVNWKQSEPASNLVHIHGDKDPVFPIDKIKNCIIVKDGTHAMIVYRSKWFNEYLPTIILQ